MVRILLLSSRFSFRYLFFGVVLWLTTVSPSFGQSTECDTLGRKVTCAIKDSSGYVVEIHRYKDGMKWGSWERFNYNGQLVEKKYYKKGERKWTFFYRDEELIKSINKKGKVKKFKGCGCT